MNERQADTKSGSTSDSGRRSKVSRVIAERELDGLGRKLEKLWTGTGNDQYSLRELADYFNQRVLQAAMQAADQDLLNGEVENLYELLTGDEITSGTQVQAEHRLERAGIDIDRLRKDFVSHQAVHTYLTKYREVEPPSDDSDTKLEKSRNTIQQLRNRLKAVTETVIDTLLNTDELSLGDYRIYVDVRVTCTDCQNQYPVTELFNSGGCECD